MAYAALGVAHTNLRQPSVATQNLKKAYELRDHVSERERYRVSALYYQFGTGELEKAIEAYELWSKTYPRDMVPHANLDPLYSAFGQYDKAPTESEEALRLEPVMGPTPILPAPTHNLAAPTTRNACCKKRRNTASTALISA